MTICQLTTFLGWASIIHIGFLLFATIMLVLMRDFVLRTHSRFFDIDKELLPAIYFKFLAGYKALSLTFFIVPYFTLKIMGC